jgi:hypothetical protein
MAVVIESAPTPNLIPLMLHFSSVLGSSWPVVLFTLEASWPAAPTYSPALRRAITSGQLRVRFLPPETEFSSSQAVSGFLTSPWLWDQLSAAKRVLLFQTDSIVCANSPVDISEFLEYDFVGAPIAPQYGQGFNGGLSLRNPSLFLDIVRTGKFENAPSGAGGAREFEDQWFYEMLKERNESMPEVSVAKRFAVETVYYERPLGYHQPDRWQKDNMAQIQEFCPETSMLIGRRAT